MPSESHAVGENTAYNHTVRRRSTSSDASVSSASSPARAAVLVHDKHHASRRKVLRSKVPKSSKTFLEWKFKERYMALQQAYEQRLQSLSAQVQALVQNLHHDAALQCLQDNPLTTEYTSIRLEELVHECFYGEREQFIRTLQSQVGLYREQVAEWKEKFATERRKQKQWEHQAHQSQQELRSVELKLEETGKAVRKYHQQLIECEEKLQACQESEQQSQFQLQTLQLELKSYQTLQHEYEALQVKMQNQHECEISASEQYVQRIQGLEAQLAQLEIEKQTCVQSNAHLKQLLALAETKAHDLTMELQSIKDVNYPNKIHLLEKALDKQTLAFATQTKELDEMKQKYQEFGRQVELYMDEQAQQQATQLAQTDEKRQMVEKQVEKERLEHQDQLKTHQNEIARLVDQLQFRKEAIQALEQTNYQLEERWKAIDTQWKDDKVQMTKQIAQLERELIEWKHLVDVERDKHASLEQLLAQQKAQYEHQVTSLQSALEQQTLQTIREKELEARTKWQNELIAKQEARMEAIKEKYEAAMEKQQSELLGARRRASESATQAAAELEQTRRKLREEEAIEKRKQDEEAARTKRLMELTVKEQEEKARLNEKKRFVQELQEREKRLDDKERELKERERTMHEERARWDDEKRRLSVEKTTKSHEKKPSVVVVKVNEPLLPENQAITSTRHQADHVSIPLAQHKAELQAAEAQAALRAEERIQQATLAFQDKKEKEFRVAMVNVRKGIQKLELSLDDTKAEKKRLEEQLTHERQTLVTLKSQFDQTNDAKRQIVQRLEEANLNIGKLRIMVKESTAQTLDMKDQVEQLREQNTTLTTQMTDQTTVITTLKEQIQRLERQLTEAKAQEDELKKKRMETAMEVEQWKAKLDAKAHEMNEMIIESQRKHNMELKELMKQHELDQQALKQQQEDAQSQLNEFMYANRQLEHDKSALQAETQRLERFVHESKDELTKQRRDFQDLVRLYRNTKEKLQQTEDQAQETSRCYKTQLHDLQVTIQSQQQAKETMMMLWRVRLQQFRSEYREFQSAIHLDLQHGWSNLEDQILKSRSEWMQQIEQRVRNEAEKSNEKETEWKTRLEQKELEMTQLLTNQHVTDQSKYDQLIAMYHHKTDEVERQLQQQKAQCTMLSEQLQAKEKEVQAQTIEMTQLTQRLHEHERQLQQNAAKLNDMAQNLAEWTTKYEEWQAFGRWCTTQFDLKGMVVSSDALFREQLQVAFVSKWKEDQQAARKPLEQELEHAKKVFATYLKDSDDDHPLPWFVRIVQRWKQQEAHHLNSIQSIQAALDAKQNEIKEKLAEVEKLREVNRLLVFEKQTITHELQLQLNSTTERHRDELTQLQHDHTHAMDQLKTRMTTQRQQLQSDHDAAIKSLKMALEAERKKGKSLNDEMRTLQIELETLRDDLEKRAREKQELESSITKWKKKAKAMKSAMSKSMIKSTIKQKSGMDTEATDESDASYRSLSSLTAMSDLSSLMEQSLQTLRQTNAQ